MRRLMRLVLASLVTAAFVSPALVSPGLAQSSGPIQTLPWGAKQRSKAGSAEQKQIDGQDMVQQTVTPQKPVIGDPEPPKAAPLK